MLNPENTITMCAPVQKFSVAYTLQKRVELTVIHVMCLFVIIVMVIKSVSKLELVMRFLKREQEHAVIISTRDFYRWIVIGYN